MNFINFDMLGYPDKLRDISFTVFVFRDFPRFFTTPKHGNGQIFSR